MLKDKISISCLPAAKASTIGVIPITSRITLSETDFTLFSGFLNLNKNLPASSIIQKTEKLMSTIFSSPVNIKLSSNNILWDVPITLKPISVLLTFVTFGVLAISIG